MRRVRAFLASAGSSLPGRVVSSPRLAVACLSWLGALVVAGTLYQSGHSSWDAQQVFFHSWIGWWGPVPFPGARLALGLLGVNLLGSLAFRIRWILTNTGLVILHAGLILLLAAGLVSGAAARTAILSLAKGHPSTVALDPVRWELYVESGAGLTSLSLDTVRPGVVLATPVAGLFVAVDGVLANSALSGGAVVSLPRNADPTRDVPSASIRITDGRDTLQRAVLFGGDQRRTRVSSPAGSFTLWLAHAATPLPAVVSLVDFTASFYPGADVPRSFQSVVQLTDARTSREAVISMNHPLRYKGWTFYQASYGTGDVGQSFSVLQVVRNPGRVLPYLASFVIAAGIAVHALLRRSARA